MSIFTIPFIIWSSVRDNLSLWFANNIGAADQPARPHSLVSVFDIHLLESFISKLATGEINDYNFLASF